MWFQQCLARPKSMIVIKHFCFHFNKFIFLHFFLIINIIIIEKEHQIEFLISGQNFTMKISDLGEERSVTNYGLFNYLNVGFEPLYIGGVPDSVKDRILNQLSHVRNSTSFKGCLSNLHINTQLKDLQQVEYSHKVSPGCLYNEACQINNNRCQNNGVCKSSFTLKTDFSCECIGEFEGQLCEISKKVEKLEYSALPLVSDELKSEKQKNINQMNVFRSKEVDNDESKSCKIAISKEIFQDEATGCKTKRKIRLFNCSGQCVDETQNNQTRFNYIIGTNKRDSSKASSTCCMPSKTKERKVKLFCDDGSTIIKDLSIVRQCKCSKKIE